MTTSLFEKIILFVLAGLVSLLIWLSDGIQNIKADVHIMQTDFAVRVEHAKLIEVNIDRRNADIKSMLLAIQKNTNEIEYIKWRSKGEKQYE